MGCGSSTESIQTTQTRGKGRSNNRPGRKSVRKMKVIIPDYLKYHNSTSTEEVLTKVRELIGDKNSEDEVLEPLVIPEKDETREMKDYNIDDLVRDKTIFRYGRKIYSIPLLQPIISTRIRYGLLNFCAISDLKREVYLNRITHIEFNQLLLVCQVGNFVDLPPDEYLSRIKQDVQLILSDDDGGGGEGLFDYKQQLSRWLRKYPNIQTQNKLSNYKTDPNKVIFPIAVGDPSIFRKWVQKWERFDTNIPKSGAWLTQELHIVKNDLATADQIHTLSLRQTRTNLGDRKWMAKRRREIANIFQENHDSLDSNIVSSFLTFADNLDKAWKEFQELCDKPFDPPERYKKIYNLKA